MRRENVPKKGRVDSLQVNIFSATHMSKNTSPSSVPPPENLFRTHNPRSASLQREWSRGSRCHLRAGMARGGGGKANKRGKDIKCYDRRGSECPAAKQNRRDSITFKAETSLLQIILDARFLLKQRGFFAPSGQLVRRLARWL